MRKLVWAGIVALALMAGCLGDVQPAEISQEELDRQGWSQSDSSEQTVAMGLAQVTTRDYRPGSGGDTTGATVATTNDVPILDERRFIPQALEKVEEERGIDFQKAGQTTVSLPELGVDQAQADVYEFSKGGANGKAILITPDRCDGFVISVGFGVTGGAGVSVSDRSYQEARDMARNVVC